MDLVQKQPFKIVQIARWHICEAIPEEQKIFAKENQHENTEAGEMQYLREEA